MPLVYAIKHFSSNLCLYPLNGLDDVTVDMLICLTQYNDKCDFVLLFEIGYVISALLLGFCLQLIMTTSGKAYHRVPIVAGFCISFTAMVLYAKFLPKVDVSHACRVDKSLVVVALYAFLSYFLMLLLYPSLMHRCQYEASTHLL